MQQQLTLEDFRRWGSIGGKISRRELKPRQARIMALHSAAARRSHSRPVTQSNVKGKCAHGTEEWAAHNVNIQVGCAHDCKYCYAKCMAIRFKRSTPNGWSRPKIMKEKVGNGYGKKYGRIMFPTTHDITPDNITECVTVLVNMLEADNDVLVVSKPHLSCVKELCRACVDFRNQILFRFTIGSTDNRLLKYWEPNAPAFQERLDALKWAFFDGFSTSVSSEPMLDGKVDALVTAVRPYVTDAIWLGRVNQLGAAISINCPRDGHARDRARELLDLHNDDWIRALYRKYCDDDKVKWKDSIKKVVGLKRPTRKGLDI